MELTAVLKMLTPPALWSIAKQICRSREICFEGDYSSWQAAADDTNGYDIPAILKQVCEATLKVKHGEAEFERDSVVFQKEDYSWPLLTGLMWAAAQNNGHLNVLDFGGSLGSSYFQNRNFLQTLPNIRWNIIEQPHYVKTGKTHFQDAQLRFYYKINDCLTENHPNVILLSSVLQYLEKPIELFQELHQVNAPYLLIDRTSFTDSVEDKLVIQKVPATIYSASYPMWIFSMPNFLKLIEKNWKIHTQFLCPEGYVRSKNGIDFFFQGMLLEARK